MSDVAMTDVESSPQTVSPAPAVEAAVAAAEPAEQPQETAAGAAEAEEDAAEDDAEEDGAATGKKGVKYPKLPTYHPIWSSLDLPSVRRSLCDASAAPRRNSHIIREGDSVIAYESRISMSPIVLKKGAVYGNRFGNFHHVDMIGQVYGSRIAARGKTKGWIVLLPFAPDLWTNSLTHRTQILYQADIAYVIFQLDLKPGDVVLESGTGSGSLTTALATTVRPHGHVHTFEFNAERAKKARIDFDNNKLSDLITVRERDIVGNGFPVVEGGANAIFLDLPAPWSVVESAHRALKHFGRICSFSPCIEQVQRTCLKLDELGFSEIVTVEILLRSFDVQATTSFPIARPQPPQPPKKPWVKKRALEEGAAEETAAEKKIKVEDGSAVAAATAGATEDATATPAATTEAATSAAAPAAATTTTPAATAAATTPAESRPLPPLTLVTTKPYQLMRGHTGYLTFAVCNKY